LTPAGRTSAEPQYWQACLQLGQSFMKQMTISSTYADQCEKEKKEKELE
jgi:hypothetical protein